jgi:hypothetical protein
MDLTNFILLACERNMLTNKFGLDIFYTAFKQASQNAAVQTGSVKHFERSVLVKDNFFLALKFLSTAIYAEREREEKIGAFEIMFAEMLQEKIETHNHKSKQFCQLTL